MLWRLATTLLFVVAAVILYLLFWPVPIEPVAWTAPPDPGYTGPFEPNDRLKAIETLSVGDNHGPEAVAVDAEGRIYASTHEGRIVRLTADGTRPENWVETGGRPLGIRFDAVGHLVVADAFRGLLRIAPDGTITVLATEADGQPILYADDLDVAADGKIYFSDASTKFGARQWGGTYEASLLDILEHGGHGRLLVWDPMTGAATTLISGLNFANGVAVSHDQTHVVVVETGSYRVLRHWLTGPKRGQTEPLIEALPGFPDNIKPGLDGRYWIALISPRNKLVDALSGRPFARKVIQRLPAFVRPKAALYGHIVAIDDRGSVVASLQDPAGAYRLNTSVLETRDYLYIGSLTMPAIGRLHKASAGL